MIVRGETNYRALKSIYDVLNEIIDNNVKKIAVSIIVEEAGTGGVYAVPIAKKLFDEYLNGGN